MEDYGRVPKKGRKLGKRDNDDEGGAPGLSGPIERGSIASGEEDLALAGGAA